MQCQNINSNFRNAHSYKDFYVIVITSKMTKCVKIINFDMQSGFIKQTKLPVNNLERVLTENHIKSISRNK